MEAFKGLGFGGLFRAWGLEAFKGFWGSEAFKGLGFGGVSGFGVRRPLRAALLLGVRPALLRDVLPMHVITHPPPEM